MGYNQVYGIVTAANKQALGRSAVSAIDTSTLIDVGGQVLDADHPANFAAFVYGLMGVINSTRIKAKSYNGASRVSAYRSPEDFGIYRRKIQPLKVRDVVANSSFTSQDADYYDGDLSVNWTDRLFGTMGGFETEKDIISRKKLARCFKDAEEMGAFISMLDTHRDNEIKASMESTETLARGTAMGACFASANTVVDLGYMYNQATGKAISKTSWRYDADFIRFAVVEMKRIIDRFKTMNCIYNNGGADRWTDDNDLVIDIHTDFTASLDGYLNNSLIENFMRLPGYNPVSRWQGTGTDKTFADAEKLIITNDNLGASAVAWSSYVSNSGKTVTVPCVLAYVHDYDAFANSIFDLRTVVGENPLQEMVTTVTKFDTGWAVDPSEQGVVFIVGDYEAVVQETRSKK